MRAWKRVLNGAFVIKNDFTSVKLFQKIGTLDDAIEDFYSLGPSKIRTVCNSDFPCAREI